MRPGEYFSKPFYPECITLIQTGEKIGMMSCNGEIKPIPSRMTIPENQQAFEEQRRYSEERELGHYICITTPSRCNIE